MFDPLSLEASSILSREFSVENLKVQWTTPLELSHGDVSTNIALQIAKKVGKKPQEIAAVLCEKLAENPSVLKAEVAGAGYVNLWLTPDALLAELNKSREACTAKVQRKNEAPIIIDYSSPNIAKPLGIHHILSTTIGQVIANVYEHEGYKVVKWNYLGDWGTQFGKLAVAFEKWGEKKAASEYTLDELLALYVRFHNEAEKDESLEAAGQEAFRKLEEGDETLRAFWEDVVAVTKATMKDLYARLHVEFDLDRGESYYEDKMDPIIEEGKEKGVFTKGEKGALIVEFSEESKLPPIVVVKGDGATLYLTRDLALMKDRIESFHPQSILWAVDVAQQLYFQQLFATVEKLGWELPHLEHMAFGRMRFADSSMSTRKGSVLKLEHVLDEAVERARKVIEERGDTIQTDNPEELAEMMGVGALVYGILSQNRKMDLVFDWDKMLSFEGNSAPYLQYTHARAKSVLRKAGEERSEIADIEALTDSERTLLRTLLLFPAVLEETRNTKMPHKLANFLYQLCQDFNSFYNSEPILKAEEPSRSLRLALTADTAAILSTGAELLTLRVPDHM
jgi:arginyl-tRNA synthetase